MSRRFIIDQKITIELCINREIILEPVCNISQSNNVHQNFKETLVFNFQSRIPVKNLKSEFSSHISVIHSIFSVVLLWQAGKYIFIYLSSLCNQKGIVFRILGFFQYLVIIGKKYTILNYYIHCLIYQIFSFCLSIFVV